MGEVGDGRLKNMKKRGVVCAGSYIWQGEEKKND